MAIIEKLFVIDISFIKIKLDENSLNTCNFNLLSIEFCVIVKFVLFEMTGPLFWNDNVAFEELEDWCCCEFVFELFDSLFELDSLFGPTLFPPLSVLFIGE